MEEQGGIADELEEAIVLLQNIKRRHDAFLSRPLALYNL